MALNVRMATHLVFRSAQIRAAHDSNSSDAKATVRCPLYWESWQAGIRIGINYAGGEEKMSAGDAHVNVAVNVSSTQCQ